MMYTLLSLSISLKLGKYIALAKRGWSFLWDLKSQLVYQRMLGFFYFFIFLGVRFTSVSAFNFYEQFFKTSTNTKYAHTLVTRSKQITQ